MSDDQIPCMTESCKTCRFGDGFNDTFRAVEALCRYNPPSIVVPAKTATYFTWTRVRHDDWCGRYEPHA